MSNDILKNYSLGLESSLGGGSLPIAQASLIAFETPGPLFISKNNPHNVIAERKINERCKSFGNSGPTTLGRA